VERATALVSLLQEGQTLLRPTALELVRLASGVLDTQPNCVELAKPEDGIVLNIVGDLHGSLDDLVEIFTNQTGWPSAENRYIFNGDFVDRGTQGIEVYFALLAWKVGLGIRSKSLILTSFEPHLNPI